MLLITLGQIAQPGHLTLGQAIPSLDLDPLAATGGMLQRRRQRSVELMWVIPARSLGWPAASRAGLLMSVSPSQAAGSNRRIQRHPHPGQRRHWQTGEQALPSLGSLGPAHSSLAVGETC